jgi:hypothetical protein
MKDLIAGLIRVWIVVSVIAIIAVAVAMIGGAL